MLVCHMFPSPSQPFFQADKAVVADHKVIDQLNIEVTTSGDELFGDGDIFWQGCRVAVWMVELLCSFSPPYRVKSSVFPPLSDWDWVQGKANVTRVGRGYTFTTRTFPHWDIHLNIGQGLRAEIPFGSKYLSGGTILVNCLEDERTVSMMKGEEENLPAHKP